MNYLRTSSEGNGISKATQGQSIGSCTDLTSENIERPRSKLSIQTEHSYRYEPWLILVSLIN